MRGTLRSWTCIPILLAVAAVGPALAGASAEADFDLLKSLEGEWVALEDGKPAGPVMLSYHVTAGGAAVVETVMPGSEHEMVTVYHRDGDAVVLTHYCMLGNRPRMRSRPDSPAGTIAFDCAGVDGAASENDAHMHRATIRLVSDDVLHAEWVEHENGKAKDGATFDLARRR